MSDAEQLGSFDITTQPAILFFPNLFVPARAKRAGKEVGEAVYSASFVFDADHPDLTSLKKRALAIANAKWPGVDFSNKDEQVATAWPWQNGTKMHEKRKAKSNKDDNEWLVGKTVLKASSKFKPNLGIIENGAIVENIQEQPMILNRAKLQFYPGALVYASINLYAYDPIDDDGKRGIKAYLQSVLTTGKGKRVANTGVSLTQRFSGVIGKLTMEDPTDGLEAETDF